MDLKTIEKELVKRKEEGWKIIRVVAYGNEGCAKRIRDIIEFSTEEGKYCNFIAKGKKISSEIKKHFIERDICDNNVEVTFERVYTDEEQREREDACCAESSLEPEPEPIPAQKGALSLMEELEEEKEKVRRLSEASISLMVCLVEVSKNFCTEDPVKKMSLRQMISATISSVAETLKPFRKGA